MSVADSTVRGIRGTGLDTSTLKDALHSLDVGLRWLEAQQREDGSWSLAQYPALTALPVMSYCMDPRRDASTALPAPARKGLAYVLRCVQPDGGIYVPSDQAPSLPHYNTALGMTALLLSGDPSYQPLIEKARRVLIAGQHLGSDVFHGGFGYEASSGKRNYADLSSTYMVLEALKMSENATSRDETETPLKQTLNWEAALRFLTRAQNLPGFNDQSWAQTPRKEDLGGFVYHPNESKAGADTSDDGSRRFHSYGSMSYAGLLSFLYAEVDREDPRLQAAIDWIRRHYTVEENPGMGPQGLYYSYHTMAKALALWGENQMVLTDGKTAWWRGDLARQLISLQRIDPKTGLGYWVNDNGRWWENDPVLATCYALMALEITVGPAVRS
jgi:squalene-hopene/tetraprenyl-beta-curcumene cyclase